MEQTTTTENKHPSEYCKDMIITALINIIHDWPDPAAYKAVVPDASKDTTEFNLIYAAGVRSEAQNDRVICDCCNKPVAVVTSTSDNHFICEGCEKDLQSFHDGLIGSVTKRCFRCKTPNLLDTWHQCLHDGGSYFQSAEAISEHNALWWSPSMDPSSKIFD